MNFLKKLLLVLCFSVSAQPAYGWSWNSIVPSITNFFTSSIPSFLSQATKFASENKTAVALGIAGLALTVIKYGYGRYSDHKEVELKEKQKRLVEAEQKANEEEQRLAEKKRAAEQREEQEKIKIEQQRIAQEAEQKAQEERERLEAERKIQEEQQENETDDELDLKDEENNNWPYLNKEAVENNFEPKVVNQQNLNEIKKDIDQGIIINASQIFASYRPEKDYSKSFIDVDRWDLLNRETITNYLQGEFHHSLSEYTWPMAMIDQKVLNSDYRDLIKPGAELVWDLLNDNFKLDDSSYALSSEESHKERNAYLANIVRVCWFIYSLALHKNEAFEEGSFIIHDDGKIFNFLLNYVKKVDPNNWGGTPVKITFNPYGCRRASTHITECQKKGKEYQHFGIDIRFGKTITGLNDLELRSAVLPAGQTHILFGKVDDNRTFIKMENDGLYYLDGWDQHVKGAVLSIARKLPIIGPVVSWWFGADDAPSNRKERIPVTIANKAKKLDLKITAIDDILTACKENPEKYRILMQEVAELYPLDVEGRIGNEVILDKCDLQCSYYYQDAAQEGHKEVIQNIVNIKNLIKQLIQSKDENISKIRENIESIVASVKDKIKDMPEILLELQTFITSNDSIQRLMHQADIERDIINNDLVSLQESIDTIFKKYEQNLQIYSKDKVINGKLKIKLDKLQSRFQLGIIPQLDGRNFSSNLYNVTSKIVNNTEEQFADICKRFENYNEKIFEVLDRLVNDLQKNVQKFAANIGEKITSLGFSHGESGENFEKCQETLRLCIARSKCIVESYFWKDKYRKGLSNTLHNLIDKKNIGTFNEFAREWALQINDQYNLVPLTESIIEDLQYFQENVFIELLGDACDELTYVHTYFINRLTFYSSPQKAEEKMNQEVERLLQQIKTSICTNTMNDDQPLGTIEEFKSNSIAIQKLKLLCHLLQQYTTRTLSVSTIINEFHNVN